MRAGDRDLPPVVRDGEAAAPPRLEGAGEQALGLGVRVELGLGLGLGVTSKEQASRRRQQARKFLAHLRRGIAEIHGRYRGDVGGI